MTIDNVASIDAGNLNEDEFNAYIKRCVKRDTPIVFGIEDFFYDEASGKNKYKLFDKLVFANYYKSLSIKFKRNLEYLFTAINNNVTINYKFIDGRVVLRKKTKDSTKIQIRFNNQLDDQNLSLELPYYDDLKDLIYNYCILEYTCEATFQEILTALDGHI